MQQLEINAVLVPMNKKWWQFWRRERVLEEGKHFTIDKKAGTIIFRVLPKKGYECKVSYNYHAPTEARGEE